MRKNVIKFISITIIGSSLFFTGCNIFPKEDKGTVPILTKANKVEYRTFEVNKGDIIEEDQGYGVAKSLNRHIIYSSMSGGRLKNVYFKQGDTVKKGDIIAELNSDDLNNEIELQELSVQVAKINYEKLNSENGDEYEKKLSQVTLQYETKKLDQLRKKRDSLIFCSPIDGIITKITASKRGNELVSSDIIAVVDGSNEIVIHATKIRRDLDIYSKGMDAIINYNGVEYLGEVTNVDKDDSQVGSKFQSAFIKFKDKIPEGLQFDKKINYKVIGDKKENVLRIPYQALLNSSNYNYVFVLENGVKIKKIVEVGMVTNKYVEIISGLEENELVVLK